MRSGRNTSLRRTIFLVSPSDLGFNNHDIQVAILFGVAARAGAENNDGRARRCLLQQLDGFTDCCLVDHGLPAAIIPLLLVGDLGGDAELPRLEPGAQGEVVREELDVEAVDERP